MHAITHAAICSEAYTKPTEKILHFCSRKCLVKEAQQHLHCTQLETASRLDETQTRSMRSR